VITDDHVTPVAVEQLQALLDELRAKNNQLETALSSRIVIEQAKGVLAERYGISTEQAFELLRRSARSSRSRLHDLASEVVTARVTPHAIALERARRPKHALDAR